MTIIIKPPVSAVDTIVLRQDKKADPQAPLKK